MSMKCISNLTFVLLFVCAASFAQAPGWEKREPRPEKFKDGEHPKPMGWGASGDIFVVMNKLKKENPEEFERLNQLRKTDFKAFIVEMKQRLPKRPDFNKIGELKKQERELAKKIIEAGDPAEKERLTAELKSKIKEDFDIMLKEAEARLDMMMQRVAAIRENEDAFLKDKMEFLLRTPGPEIRPPQK